MTTSDVCRLGVFLIGSERRGTAIDRAAGLGYALLHTAGDGCPK